MTVATIGTVGNAFGAFLWSFFIRNPALSSRASGRLRRRVYPGGENGASKRLCSRARGRAGKSAPGTAVRVRAGASTDRGSGVTRTGAQSRTAGRPANRTSTSGRRAQPAAPKRFAVLSLLAKVTAAVLFGLVVVAGLFYVRLMHGPISLNYLIG